MSNTTNNYLTLNKETIENIKLMNDETFIQYVRNNFLAIENLIIYNPITLKKGQIHPEEILSIIMSENFDEEDGIDTTILRDYLTNKL
jgi:hypothetical protein